MREQIRLWFYSHALHERRARSAPRRYRRVLGYEKLNDETGRAMHKSWGNAIWFDDAVEQMGADVMRWLYARPGAGPEHELRLRPGHAGRGRLLTLWNSYRFLVLNANPEGWRPVWGEAVRSDHPLDRWLAARTAELVRESREVLDRYDSPDFVRAVERFWDDLSNWYVRRSRPRFWRGDDGGLRLAPPGARDALRALRLRRSCRSWPRSCGRTSSRGRCPDAPRCVHLAGYPEVDEAALDAALSARDERRARRRGARAERARRRQRCGCGSRWPRSRSRRPTPRAPPCLERLLDEIASELNVKRVDLVGDSAELVEREVVPNFRVLGPRLGGRVQQLRSDLASGEYHPDAEGRVTVGELVLEPGDYELRTRSREGFESVGDGTFVVAIDTRVTDELAIEGLARDLVRHLQNARKELGFDVSDRIRVGYDADERAGAALAAHGEWIAGEVLAIELEPGEAGDHPFDAGGASARFAIARA